MLNPRIITCLLVHNRGLVKTCKFKNPKYIGDPLNSVKIFNEKEVDELVVLDIDATVHSQKPNFKMIENLAIECRMPLCYGGGIQTVEHAIQILGLGVEKVALSNAAINKPELISQISKQAGAQSVVVILDIKKQNLSGKYEIWTHNATRKTGLSPVQFSREAEARGAGEIVINSIDHDGMMNDYDLQLIDQIRATIHLPISVFGGAGSLDNIGKLIQRFGIIGAGAGSIFVFKGKYRAVLINYPNPDEKQKLLNQYFPNCNG